MDIDVSHDVPLGGTFGDHQFPLPPWSLWLYTSVKCHHILYKYVDLVLGENNVFKTLPLIGYLYTYNTIGILFKAHYTK